METRDFLGKQIDQLGKVLAALFNKLFKEPDQFISIEDNETIQMFQDDLSIDLGEVSKLSQDELMEFLINERGYSFENLEKLVKVIALIRKGDHSFTDNTLKSIELSILNHLTTNDKNFSFERQMRIDHLKKSVQTE